MLRLQIPYHRTSAFASCGSAWWVLRHRTEPERFKRVLDTCHDRFCVPCSRARAATIRRNLHDHLDDHPRRFLTLTIRHNREPLRVLLQRLYRGFRRLRQRPLWKERVTGGVAMLEVKVSERSQWWHPHLHLIIEGRYLPREELQTEWLRVTGDSWNVDIRLIRDESELQHYITKYVTKGLPPEAIDRPARIEEAILALKGTRMVITFGRWRRWRLLAEPTDESWILFDHENAVRFRAGDGDALCAAIVAMWDHADLHTGEMLIDLEQLPPPES